jgi:hypothetical protein
MVSVRPEIAVRIGFLSGRFRIRKRSFGQRSSNRGSDPFRTFELKTARPNLRMLNVLWVGRRYLCSGATLASFIP